MLFVSFFFWGGVGSFKCHACQKFRLWPPLLQNPGSASVLCSGGGEGDYEYNRNTTDIPAAVASYAVSVLTSVTISSRPSDTPSGSGSAKGTVSAKGIVSVVTPDYIALCCLVVTAYLNITVCKGTRERK